MKKTKSLLVALGLFSLQLAFGDEQAVNEVWTCTLNEGATMDEVRKANSAWVSFVNSKLDGNPVASATVTTIVGDYSRFLIVDSYPNLQVWTEAKKAIEGEDSQEVSESLDKVLSCPKNELFESTPS